jgi:hypothetical protein
VGTGVQLNNGPECHQPPAHAATDDNATTNGNGTLSLDYLGDNVDLQQIFDDLFADDELDIDKFCNDIIEEEYASSTSPSPSTVSSVGESSPSDYDRSRSSSFTSQTCEQTAASSSQPLHYAPAEEVNVANTVGGVLSPTQQVPSPNRGQVDFPFSPEYASIVDDPMLFSEKFTEFADPEPWNFVGSNIALSSVDDHFSSDLLLDDCLLSQ